EPPPGGGRGARAAGRGRGPSGDGPSAGPVAWRRPRRGGRERRRDRRAAGRGTDRHGGRARKATRRPAPARGDALGEEVENGVELGARQVAVRIGTAHEREQLLDAELGGGSHGDTTF